MSPGPTSPWRTRSVRAACPCTSGTSVPRARTRGSSRSGRPVWAPTSWGATCSGPTAASGTSTGPAGGARSRRTACRCSCSVIAPDPRSAVGRTTFHFVTDGIEAALDQARAAAGEERVAIAGGASTANQYLAAGLVDQLHLHIAPLVLGAGERLFDGVPPTTLEPVQVVSTPCRDPREVRDRVNSDDRPAARSRAELSRPATSTLFLFRRLFIRLVVTGYRAALFAAMTRKRTWLRFIQCSALGPAPSPST